MPRTFITQEILDTQIDQIVITYTKDINNNPDIRVRSSAKVVLADSLDTKKNKEFSVNLNKSIADLNPSVVAHVNAIKNIVLTELRDQIA